MHHCKTSLEVRSLNNQSREYANLIYLKAKILYKLGSAKEAKQLHDEAHLLRLEMPNKSDLADSLFDIGVVDIDKKKYFSGFEKINEAIDIYICKGYTNQISQVKKYLLSIIPYLKDGELEIANGSLIKIETFLADNNKF